MGRAMLSGWIKSDIIKSCHIVDPGIAEAPFDHDALKIHKDTSNIPKTTDVVVFAVKPQIMADVIPNYSGLMDSAVGISIAAGAPISLFEKTFGQNSQMIRVMPNTPAAIGEGITALYAKPAVSESARTIAEKLNVSLGPFLWCEQEDQMHHITALSGSGPAYVFYLIEAMAKAGEKLGLSPRDAMSLARQTVIGAAALVKSSPDKTAEDLRKAVTSPNGTTAAGLGVLMQTDDGLDDLMVKALKAASDRSKALAQE